jgi:hypothetical protein
MYRYTIIQHTLSAGKVQTRMLKRSAYEAEADEDDDDVVMKAKRVKADTMIVDYRIPKVTWRTIKADLWRYYQYRFPSTSMLDIDAGVRLTFTSRMVRIPWGPKTHFMRWEREWRRIFMLIVLHHHGKLPIPYDTLELIINFRVMSGVVTCNACRSYLRSRYCVKCEGNLNVVIDYRDLVNFL